MAYAAVISVKQTIHRLLNSSHTPVVSSSREILEFAHKHATSSQEFLTKFYDVNSKRWNALDVKIRDAAQKLEDALEFIVSNQFRSLPDLRDLDFEEAKQEIDSFVEAMKRMEEEYVRDESDEDEEEYVSSNTDFGVEMVGLSKEYAEIRDRLLKPMRPYDFGVFSFVGKKGSSRSLCAKAIFDQVIVGKEQPFDCGAWVTVGPNFQLTEILVQILAQIDDHHPRSSNCHVLEKLGEDLYASLRGRRYLIALDDIDDVEVWGYLGKLFPEQDNGSLILLATSIMEVAQFAKSFYIHEMPLLMNDHFAWDYLRLIMFGIEKTIHPEFERSGQTIAANCGQSRIALARVILFLNKADKTPECWSKLAADKLNSIFVVEDEISEVCKIKEDMQRLDETIRSSITSIVQVSSGTNIIKEYLFPERYFPKSEIMLICGMAGIGKTTIIKNIFEDTSISHHFDHRVWITLGPKYKSKEILVDILAQIYPNIHRKHLKEDTKLGMELCDKLSRNKRCFLVLDDLWSPEPVHQLKVLLPNIKAEIFVTTRLPILGLKFSPDDRFYTIRLLNKEESWDLFCKKVFSDRPCPPELEKVGKKISKNCEGLPLLILTIASLIAKTEKTLEYWNTVAEKQDSILGDVYDRMSKVLYPSYEYLPQHLKACFLYMGVFPRSYVIPTSKLIRLWVAEGFLEPDTSSLETVEDFGVKCLKDIVLRSLVMVKNKDYEPKSSKTCSLHSVFWLLSSNEAESNKFFHALNSYGGDSIQGWKDQRRVCIRNNILLGIKDVHSSMSTRSLLCTGPHHRYPVPISFRPRLLRVLDALSIRLYEFPIEAVDLIHLRYLALTCSGGLPPSISKLRNLENLIVGRHLSTKSCYLPMEIWNMKELKYLRVTGCNLPIPIPNTDSGDVLVLANLSTLLDVSIDSCNEEVLKGVPNLKKLGVRIELEPGDNGQSFHYLNHISCLNKLESLKCVVVNPEVAVTPPAPHSMFPPGLKKLSLSGLGYPWSYMSIIGTLPNLEVLKLRCYAFRGQTWETDFVSFCQVKFLSIEDTDLEQWRVRNPSFFSMKYLRIRDCYNLRELPHYLPCTATLEVVDCSPAVVVWAEQMREMDWESRVEKLTSLRLHSSWDHHSIKW